MSLIMIELPQSITDDAAEEAFIAQIGKLLAKEYIALMKQNMESNDEGSDLCSLLERESEAAKY